MPPKRHWMDQTVDDLGEWMTSTQDHLISGLYDGDRAPGAAPLNNKQLVDTYEAQWFPGGVRDEAAIQSFIQQRGQPAYARVLLEISARRRRDMNAAPQHWPGAPEQGPRAAESPPLREGY